MNNLLKMKVYFIGLLFCLMVTFLQCNTSSEPERLMNGVKFPNIEETDTLGNLIAVNSFENKIVLVDFWASWCKPCLKAFPEMEKMYQKYKDAKIGNADGFEIYSVSLDESRKAWERALKRQNPSWKYQFIDTTAFTSKYIEQLQFEEIPAYFLVDERGIIIGINQTFAWMDYELRRRME
ncbi:MAG: TlpA family protein disulfide reductase [Chitinophagales bacterium]